MPLRPRPTWRPRRRPRRSAAAAETPTAEAERGHCPSRAFRQPGEKIKQSGISMWGCVISQSPLSATRGTCPARNYVASCVRVRGEQRSNEASRRYRSETLSLTLRNSFRASINKYIIAGPPANPHSSLLVTEQSALLLHFDKDTSSSLILFISQSHYPSLPLPMCSTHIDCVESPFPCFACGRY